MPISHFQNETHDDESICEYAMQAALVGLAPKSIRSQNCGNPRELFYHPHPSIPSQPLFDDLWKDIKHSSDFVRNSASLAEDKHHIYGRNVLVNRGLPQTTGQGVLLHDAYSFIDPESLASKVDSTSIVDFSHEPISSASSSSLILSSSSSSLPSPIPSPLSQAIPEPRQGDIVRRSFGETIGPEVPWFPPAKVSVPYPKASVGISAAGPHVVAARQKFPRRSQKEFRSTVVKNLLREMTVYSSSTSKENVVTAKGHDRNKEKMRVDHGQKDELPWSPLVLPGHFLQ